MHPIVARTLIALAVLASSTSGRAADLAVIVHPANALTELSSGELREILLLERQHWRATGRVYVVLPESGTAEKDLLLRSALHLTEDQLHRIYLGKLYGGEIPEFPQVVATGALARRIVARAPNALAVVDAATVDASVKVLRIDGRGPGEAGYLLASRRTSSP
jgi:hypothetical protein